MRENVSRPRRSRRQTVPTMAPAQDRAGGIGEAGVRSAAMDARHDPGADLATRRAESIEDAAAEPIRVRGGGWVRVGTASWTDPTMTDRKSTRLNSSHITISYAVFCLKKTKTKTP